MTKPATEKVEVKEVTGRWIRSRLRKCLKGVTTGEGEFDVTEAILVRFVSTSTPCSQNSDTAQELDKYLRNIYVYIFLCLRRLKNPKSNTNH